MMSSRKEEEAVQGGTVGDQAPSCNGASEEGVVTLEADGDCAGVAAADMDSVNKGVSATVVDGDSVVDGEIVVEGGGL
jgi:hypothetical protein